jgi:hypothetical protein
MCRVAVACALTFAGVFSTSDRCRGYFNTAAWTGPSHRLSVQFAGGCPPPAVSQIVSRFRDTRIYFAGDSTFRLPVQFFEAAWLGCSTSGVIPSGLVPVEHALCDAMQRGNKSFLWMQRPLDGRLVLSYEVYRHVENYTSTQWWTKWVASDAYLATVEPREQELMDKLPDALVIGAWLWHAGYPPVPPPAPMDAILADYDAKLRRFLADLTAQPSYAAYWSRGRLFWRAALPTEVPLTAFVDGIEVPLRKHRVGVALANALAQKALAELAPDVRFLEQGQLVRHETDNARFTAPAHALEPLLTSDGIHFRGPVQVVLMQHVLLAVLGSLQDATGQLHEVETPSSFNLTRAVSGPAGMAFGLMAAAVVALAACALVWLVSCQAVATRVIPSLPPLLGTLQPAPPRKPQAQAQMKLADDERGEGSVALVPRRLQAQGLRLLA